jgi:sulfite reductase alpha subunit-like flavoprotein
MFVLVVMIVYFKCFDWRLEHVASYLLLITSRYYSTVRHPTSPTFSIPLAGMVCELNAAEDCREAGRWSRRQG